MSQIRFPVSDVANARKRATNVTNSIFFDKLLFIKLLAID